MQIMNPIILAEKMAGNDIGRMMLIASPASGVAFMQKSVAIRNATIPIEISLNEVKSAAFLKLKIAEAFSFSTNGMKVSILVDISYIDFCDKKEEYLNLLRDIFTPDDNVYTVITNDEQTGKTIANADNVSVIIKLSRVNLQIPYQLESLFDIYLWDLFELV